MSPRLIIGRIQSKMCQSSTKIINVNSVIWKYFACLSLVVTLVIVVILACNYLPVSTMTPTLKEEEWTIEDFEYYYPREKKTSLENETEDWEALNTSPDEKLNDILTSQIRLNGQELEGYAFSPGRTLDDLMMSRGGQPIRSVIFTYWRSGSTFLGDILDSHPANFYYYEPLASLGGMQVIRDGPKSQEALRRIKQMLICNYTGSGMNYVHDLMQSSKHNHRLWKQCNRYIRLCSNPDYTNQFCSLFPFQSMKVVGLLLSHAKTLLDDPDLNLRIVYLVRDPRGTMQSRKHYVLCFLDSDCHDPRHVCDDLVSDYEAAKSMQLKYKDRFRVVRYEDLSLDPHKAMHDLLQFLDLYMHPSVADFLDTHTKVNHGDLHSTFRDSSSNAFHWKNNLTFQEVKSIQDNCWKAMDMWGYIKADNDTHQKLLFPIKELIWDNYNN